MLNFFIILFSYNRFIKRQPCHVSVNIFFKKLLLKNFLLYQREIIIFPMFYLSTVNPLNLFYSKFLAFGKGSIHVLILGKYHLLDKLMYEYKYRYRYSTLFRLAVFFEGNVEVLSKPCSCPCHPLKLRHFITSFFTKYINCKQGQVGF